MSIGPRDQLRIEDVGDPMRLQKALNDILLSIQTRLDSLNQLYLPAAFELVTNATSTAYGQAPFPLRVALPPDVRPAGVILGGIENQSLSGAPATVAHDVKWAVKPGGGGLLVQHIPGLAVSTKYLVRLVVIRG